MKLRFLPGGEVRGLWDDDLGGLLRAAGAAPRRGSHVFVIEEGAHAGRFAVDLSPLGPGFGVCLAETFARYDAAVAAERDWINTHWVAAGRPQPCTEGR